MNPSEIKYWCPSCASMLRRWAILCYDEPPPLGDTEAPGDWVEGWSSTAPTRCFNDDSHAVEKGSVMCLPAASDDVAPRPGISLRERDIETQRRPGVPQLPPLCVEVRHANDEDEPDARRACVVCCEKSRRILLRPCNHVCMCAACARRLYETRRLEVCPVCRASVSGVELVFIY